MYVEQYLLNWNASCSLYINFFNSDFQILNFFTNPFEVPLIICQQILLVIHITPRQPKIYYSISSEMLKFVASSDLLSKVDSLDLLRCAGSPDVFRKVGSLTFMMSWQLWHLKLCWQPWHLKMCWQPQNYLKQVLYIQVKWKYILCVHKQIYVGWQ